jgi:hypothetical protein
MDMRQRPDLLYCLSMKTVKCSANRNFKYQVYYKDTWPCSILLLCSQFQRLINDINTPNKLNQPFNAGGRAPFTLLMNSKEQSLTSETNSRIPSQEICRHLWNPKVHYLVHNSSPLVPILIQMNLVHIFQSYFLKIHSNIYYSPIFVEVLQDVYSLQTFRLKFCTSFSSLTCVLHDLPLSSSLIWSP